MGDHRRLMLAAALTALALTIALASCSPASGRPSSATRTPPAAPPAPGGPPAAPALPGDPPLPPDRSVTAPHAGPPVSAAATDAIIAATLRRTGGTNATIEGYIVDFVRADANSQVILEVIAMKDGRLLEWERPIRPRPEAAFAKAPRPRATPEGPGERAAREKTLTAAAGRVDRESPTFAGIQPQVYDYLLRVKKPDGTSAYVIVAPDAATNSFRVGTYTFKPWSDASAGGGPDLD